MKFSLLKFDSILFYFVLKWLKIVCVCVSGALDFLEKSTIAFVRLKKDQVLEMTLEASAPVRFIFVLIGSTKSDLDYHEMGRSITALLADNVKTVTFYS